MPESIQAACIVYSAESPLRRPRRFLGQALHDLRGSTETAARLFRQAIALRYRYSSLGLMWAFVPSALSAILVTLGQRANLTSATSAQVPPQVYTVFGMIMVQTFLETFNTQRTLFTTHRYLLNRHLSPIEGLIIAGMGENFIGLLMKVVLLAAVFVVYGVKPVATLPLGILGMVAIFLLGTCLGLLLAPWNALKRDIDNLMIVLPWVIFGVTPVFVPLKPGSPLATVYGLNPLTWILETTRHFTYGYGAGSLGMLLFFLALTLILLPIAWLICRIARPFVVERFLV